MRVCLNPISDAVGAFVPPARQTVFAPRPPFYREGAGRRASPPDRSVTNRPSLEPAQFRLPPTAKRL